MGNCVSEPKTHKKGKRSSCVSTLSNRLRADGLSTNDIIRRTSSLTIIPGDLENIGYVMHDVIVRNNLRHCEYLLKKGFPINTPLKYSASIPATVDKTLYYEFCGTALHVACIYRRPVIVERLIWHGADPNLVDRFGRTPLMLTVTYWPRVENEFALTTAHWRKSSMCLQCLCINGADVNGRFGDEEETALHLAARYNIASCVQALIKFGAEVNAVDKKGLTALHSACKRLTEHKDDLQVVSVLLQHGADVNQQDEEGNSALHTAAETGNCAIISKLMSYGADPELKNARELTPLYLMLNSEFCATKSQTLDALLNDCTYLRIFDSAGKLPSVLQLPEMSDIRASLLLLATTPPKLKLICRQSIRKAVGIRNVSANVVAALPIPITLKNEIVAQIKYDINFVQEITLN